MVSPPRNGDCAVQPIAALPSLAVSARRQARACCPACAASVGGRGPLGLVPPPWRRRARARIGLAGLGWLGVVGLLAALVPIAALGGADGERAFALSPATAPDQLVGILPGRPPVVLGTAEDEAPVIGDHGSLALGLPNAGRLQDGVRLPLHAPGYYTYNPDTQRPPGGPERQWGTAMLVRQVVALGAWWAATHPEAPRLGIGDLSLRHGGPFDSDHASHQNGLDVDIRLPRRDGVEGPATPARYDRALTQQLVDRLEAQGASLILKGPSLDLSGPHVVVWPNHDDHLHVRFPDPDGTGN
jgi:hypothetical protein